MAFTDKTTHRMSKVESRLPKTKPKEKKPNRATKPKSHSKIYKIRCSRAIWGPNTEIVLPPEIGG